jgi:hypothetical protein
MDTFHNESRYFDAIPSHHSGIHCGRLVSGKFELQTNAFEANSWKSEFRDHIDETLRFPPFNLTSPCIISSILATDSSTTSKL